MSAGAGTMAAHMHESAMLFLPPPVPRAALIAIITRHLPPLGRFCTRGRPRHVSRIRMAAASAA